MSDTQTPEQRHKNMAAIRAKDTKPEIIVRHYLWNHGYRYRLNHKRLPGKPDIVMRKYKTCIFVNGCFWHGHKLVIGEHVQTVQTANPLNPPRGTCDLGQTIQSSECCKIPKTRTDFWVKKILRNKERDEEVQHKLAQMGWHCITIWECELRPERRQSTLESLLYTLNTIFLGDHQLNKFETEEEETLLVAEEEEGKSTESAI